MLRARRHIKARRHLWFRATRKIRSEAHASSQLESNIKSNNAAREGKSYRICPIGRAKFDDGALQVKIDGTFGDAQCLGDSL